MSLYLFAGLEYAENGKSFILMYVACSQQRWEDGLKRFQRIIQSYKDND